MFQHAETRPWWPEVARGTMVWYPARKDACKAETDAIDAEKPVYNVRKQSSPNSTPIGPRLKTVDADQQGPWLAGEWVEFPLGSWRRRKTPEAPFGFDF
jgi:hypothetical protein